MNNSIRIHASTAIICLHVLVGFFPNKTAIGMLTFIAIPFSIWIYNNRTWKNRLLERIIFHVTLTALILFTKWQGGYGSFLVLIAFGCSILWAQATLDWIFRQTHAWMAIGLWAAILLFAIAYFALCMWLDRAIDILRFRMSGVYAVTFQLLSSLWILWRLNPRKDH